MKTALKNFLKHTLVQGKFDGCAYHYLDDHYAVVLAWDDEYGLMGKIAFNCDDLQCDYDIDWLLPLTKSEEVVYVELAHCEAYESVDQLTDDFLEYYRQVLENDREIANYSQK